MAESLTAESLMAESLMEESLMAESLTAESLTAESLTAEILMAESLETVRVIVKEMVKAKIRVVIVNIFLIGFVRRMPIQIIWIFRELLKG